MIGLLLFYFLLRIRHSRERIVSEVLSACVLASIVLSVGCNRGEIASEQVDAEKTAVATPIKRTEPIHSVAAETAMASSPAANSLTVDPATQSPESLCRAFIKRLQNGDRIGAENLLTRVALTTTHHANLKLEPISGPDATTTVHSARFTDQFNRSAEVDCLITETMNGETFPISLTWQVVRQSNGWRVCGMFVPLGASDQRQLLSFESIDDVATIKLLAAGEAFSAEKPQQQVRELRQADANEADTSLQ
jgi:hypothetical protein